MADQFAYTPYIIRENREILSQAHLDQINDKFPVKMNNNYEFETQLNYQQKQKQVKSKWSEKEQILFMEGIELYGVKSIFLICKIRFKESS